MLNFSYNITSKIRQNLDIFEAKRRNILVSPLSPRHELMLRWTTMRDRVYYSLALADGALSKKEMTTLLTRQPVGFENTKKMTRHERQATRYRKALEFIRSDWLTTRKQITAEEIIKLNKLATKGSLQIEISALRELAEYLEKEENIIIKSLIAHNQLKSLGAFTQGNARTARLLTLLILYKHGLDVKGTLNLDEYFYDNLATYIRIGQIITKEHNLTAWLEFATTGLVESLEHVEKKIDTWTTSSTDLGIVDTHQIPESFWELTERQKNIISLLQQPLTTLTNRKVQKLFKVSQITSSRDLAHLTSVGLLLSHGKGRSVYYTRV